MNAALLMIVPKHGDCVRVDRSKQNRFRKGAHVRDPILPVTTLARFVVGALPALRAKGEGGGRMELGARGLLFFRGKAYIP